MLTDKRHNLLLGAIGPETPAIAILDLIYYNISMEKIQGGFGCGKDWKKDWKKRGYVQHEADNEFFNSLV
jgi:hypothetical protein